MSRDVRKGHRRGRSLEDKDPRASTKAQHDNGGKNDSKRTRNASQTQHEMSNRIISTLLSEFTEHAQRKIEEIMKLGTDQKFLLSDIVESDPKMHQLLSSLSGIAKFPALASHLVGELLRWRAVQIEKIKQKPEKSKPSKDAALLEERNRLAVEFIFCSAVLPIVECLASTAIRSGTNATTTADTMGSHSTHLGNVFLRVELCQELENLAFQHFKPPVNESRPSMVSLDLSGTADTSRTTLEINRKKVPTLYAKILGVLSQYRMGEIAPRFLKEITSNSVRSKKAVYVIQAIRYLKFQLTTYAGIEQACTFVPALFQLFQASQRVEVKQAFADILLILLRPWILLSQIAPQANQQSSAHLPPSSTLIGDDDDDDDDDSDEVGKLVDSSSSDNEQETPSPSPSKTFGIPRRSGGKTSGREVSQEPVQQPQLPTTQTTSGGNSASNSPDYNRWFNLLLELYLTKVLHPKKKHKMSKEVIAGLPMKTAFLCACRTSDFMVYFWPLMHELLDYLKDTKSASTALECILVLLEARLMKFSDTSELQQQLEEIAQCVFSNVPSKRVPTFTLKPWRHKGEPHDVFVDLICAIARVKLDFAMEHIVFKLLSSVGQTEKMLIAVLAVKELWTAAAEKRPASSSRYMKDSPAGGFYVTTAALEPYNERVSQLWWDAISALDKLYGNLLYSTQTKPLFDLIRPERDLMCIELLRTMILCIPVIMPKVDDQSLVRLLSKYLIHLDKGLGEMATGALSRLMTDRPHFRPLIIHGVSEFVLAIPHNRHDLVFTLFFKLGQLLKRWVEVLKSPGPEWHVEPASLSESSTQVSFQQVSSTESESQFSQRHSAHDIQLPPPPYGRVSTIVPSPNNLLDNRSSDKAAISSANSEAGGSSALASASGMGELPRGTDMSGAGLSSAYSKVSTTEKTSGQITAAVALSTGAAGPSSSGVSSSGMHSSDRPRYSIAEINSALHQLETFPVEKVEGIALIFLCSPRAKIRLLSLEILRSVRTVETELAAIANYTDPRLPSSRKMSSPHYNTGIRVMDIIDETQSEVFKYLQKERSSFLKSASTQPSPLPVKTIERLAARESREDQFLWSHAFAEILKHVRFILPAPAIYACSLALSRFQALQPDEMESRSALSIEQEEMMYWWRNYIVVASVTVPSKPSHRLFRYGLTHNNYFNITGDASVRRGSDAQADIPTNARELFQALLPLLKSSNDVHREAAVMALQRANPSCYEILFECMRPYEKEFMGEHDVKKRKPKKERLRYEISSIYTYIAEYARPGTIMSNPTLKNYFITFTEEMRSFLKAYKNILEHLPLRYQFAVLVRRVAEELYLTRADNTFEDDQRLRRDLFYLLAKWCGPDVLSEEIVKKYMNNILSTVKDLDKRKAYTTVLQQHILTVQLAAFQAMSACLMGPHFEAIQPNDSFFSFVHSFLNNPDERVRYFARLMLQAFLQGNLSQPHVLHIALNACYQANPDIASSYFLCLVELFSEEKLYCPVITIIHLIIYMMGDEQYIVRKSAHELLLLLKSLSHDEERWQNMPLVIESSLHENYEQAQMELSIRLSQYHHDQATDLVNEMVLRLDSVTHRAKRQMLRYILPWLETIDLTTLAPAVLDNLMDNLLLITLKYGQEMRNEAQQIWATVAQKPQNTAVVIHKLLSIGMQKQNVDFIPLVKLVCVYLARKSAKVVIDALVAELSSMDPSQGDVQRSVVTSGTNQADNQAGSSNTASSSTPNPNTNQAYQQSDLNTPTQVRRAKSAPVKEQEKPHGSSPLESGSPNTLPTPSSSATASTATPAGSGTPDITTEVASSSSDEEYDTVESSELSSSIALGHPFSQLMPALLTPWGLTRGHLTLIVLAQLTYETPECFKEQQHLPIIFQLALLGLDYQHELVYEHCRIIILNLIHSLVVVPLSAVEQRTPEQQNTFQLAVEFVGYLKANAGQQLWPMEDITMKRPEIKSAIQLTQLVQNITALLPDVTESWASQALSWAVNCQNWHLSGRSFQIYRALKPTITREAQNDLLECLLRSLSQANTNPNESLPQTLEILRTLLTLVREMPSHKLILFPQIFWAAVAILHTDFEQHYLHALQLLCDLLDRLNFGDQYVQNIFSASIPRDWEPPFKGVQPLVIRGLFSSLTEPKTIEVLSKLTVTPYDPIFHVEPGRLMVNMTALLPYLCSNYRYPNMRAKCTQIAERLSTACAGKSYSQLAKLFTKLARYEYTSIDDFISDLRRPLARALAPFRLESALSLLFALLEGGPSQWRKSILAIVHSILLYKAHPNNSTHSSAGVSSDFVEERRASNESLRSTWSDSNSVLLEPSWLSTLLKFIPSSSWRSVQPIIDLLLQHSPVPSAYRSAAGDVLLTSTKSRGSTPRAFNFTNKVGDGVAAARRALDKILLSTEQRRRMTTIDKSVFSIFGVGQNLGDENEQHSKKPERKPSLRPKTKQSVDSEKAAGPLVMAPEEFEEGGGATDESSTSESDDLDLTVNAFSRMQVTFGNFPSFRGFEELLSKLEAL